MSPMQLLKGIEGHWEQLGANSYDVVCNIYDLQDNGLECTREREWHMFNGSRSESVQRRGGSYWDNAPAAYRNAWNDWDQDYTTFRMVLYVMR